VFLASLLPCWAVSAIAVAVSFGDRLLPLRLGNVV